jgi:hypothetical protein
MPDVNNAVQYALTFKSNCTQKEKMLIDAMSVRYSNDSTFSREELNQRYKDAMMKVYGQLEKDADIATLFTGAR